MEQRGQAGQVGPSRRPASVAERDSLDPTGVTGIGLAARTRRGYLRARRRAGALLAATARRRTPAQPEGDDLNPDSRDESVHADRPAEGVRARPSGPVHSGPVAPSGSPSALPHSAADVPPPAARQA